MTLYTVGHGTRSLDELVEVLVKAGVALLADVRRHPGSRRSPHFARDALARMLPEHGIAYEWWGEALGGRRRPAPDSRNRVWRDASFRAYADHLGTAEGAQAMGALLERTARSPLAVMCAETVWWRCHRRLIADAAVLAGMPVVHLGLDRPREHELHAAARPGAEGRIVYDPGDEPPLPM